MNPFNFGSVGDGLERSLEVDDCEFPRLTIIEIAQYPTAARRPGVGDGHSLAAHEMPDRRDSKNRRFEIVIHPMNVKVDILFRRQRQAFLKILLKLLFLLLDAGCELRLELN